MYVLLCYSSSSRLLIVYYCETRNLYNENKTQQTMFPGSIVPDALLFFLSFFLTPFFFYTFFHCRFQIHTEEYKRDITVNNYIEF